MIWKLQFVTWNHLGQFRIITFILLFSIICSHPVNSRPSTSIENPSHSHPHEITDINPQQSEDPNNEDEQFLTELEIPEVVEDDLNLDEEYPQQDAPMEENRGPRKQDNRHSKPHHVKNGRKTISAQQAVVLREPSESNDPVPDTLQDFNLKDINGTLNGDQGDNSTVVDENVIRLSQKNRESQDKELANRIRELRLNAIKEVIQNYRAGTAGGEPKPTKLPIEVFEKIVGKLNISQPPPLDAYPMKRRSFHPSCSLPNNTDVEMWADSNSMNLLFNLSYPAPQNTTVTIIAATLRLYKFAQGNRTLAEPSCTPNIAPTPLSDIEVDDLFEHQQDSPLISELGLPSLTPTPNALQDDDKQVRVSVYWYTRSLKRNKAKRKLLDSRMLSVFGKDEWVEFNVRHAARQWRQLGKNFGLVVEVENEDGEVLKASDYFKIMNCSNEASTAKPLPGVLLPAVRTIIESNYSGGAGFDIAALLGGATGFIYSAPNGNNGGERKRDLGDDFPTGKFSSSPYVYSFLFPVIDLCTVEIPAKEAANAAFLQHTQYLLTQHLAPCKSNTENQTDVQKTHGAIKTQQTATDVNENETLVETQDNSDQNNISHAHREEHKKDHHHHSTHMNPHEDTPMQEPAHGNKLRHSRHKHRPHNNNNHFDEESIKRRDNDEEQENEREEIKEEVTLTDEFGRELRKKIIVKEVIRSSSHRDSHPQRDSDR